jgi:drug/metabolite transporter (DMT)-like permease
MKTEMAGTEAGLERTHGVRAKPPLWQVLAAFAAIYLIWGSTYLGIRYAVETIPPFLMAGTRFLAAGLLLYGFARWRGAGSPGLGEWRDATIAGGLMILIGNGGVTWAELVIPSGVAALLVALTPLWMVLFDWLRPNGVRPGWLVFAGLAVGVVGVAVLARGTGNGSGPMYAWGVAALMAASVSWALGSIFNRHARKPGSPWLAIAMQMIAGGGLMLLLSLLRGETSAFSFSRLTMLSAWAWLYLTLVGSLIGFTAYIWLLQVSTPARVSTYAYVNPLIAVVLGCTIGREPFSRELLAAGALIILAIALIVSSGAGKPRSIAAKTEATRAPSETP